MRKPKEPVRLRFKKLQDGKQSIYLDIYYKGRRAYEFLRLYIYPEYGKEDRDKNRDTIQLAEAIKAKRIVEIRNEDYGFDSIPDVTICLADYAKALAAKRHNEAFGSLAFRLRDCFGAMTLRDVNEKTGEEFFRYLKLATSTKSRKVKPLSSVTIRNLINNLQVAVNSAVKDGLLKSNPIRTDNIKFGPPKQRSYLSLQEVRAMAALDVVRDQVKRAFLFSCLTGLRYSDIQKLTWGEISEMAGYTRITFNQKKTGGLEYLDISPEAVRLLGSRGKNNEAVFVNFELTKRDRIELRQWAKTAGINKPIMFHTARHTFAVMMLELDTDIYTVSKLLGHRSLKTTQVYAEIVDHKKREAISKIPALDLEL